MRLETSRVGPRVRIEPRDADAIQTIPPSVIEPFLSKPLVVSANELDAHAGDRRDAGRPRRAGAGQHRLRARRRPKRRDALAGFPARRSARRSRTRSSCSATSASTSAKRSCARARRDQHDRDHQGRAGSLSRRPARAVPEGKPGLRLRAARAAEPGPRPHRFDLRRPVGNRPARDRHALERHARRPRSRPRAGDPPRPAQRALRGAHRAAVRPRRADRQRQAHSVLPGRSAGARQPALQGRAAGARVGLRSSCPQSATASC